MTPFKRLTIIRVLKSGITPEHTLARLAQSVEQGIENPRVGGSIPPPGTIISKETRIRQRVRVFFFLPQVDAASGGRNTARSGVKL